MPTPLEERILELSLQLKAEVAEYELENFAGFFAYFIKHRPTVEEGALDKFESKYKDFSYLIALNATAKARGNKEIDVADPIIAKWADDLKTIKNLYKEGVLGDIQSLEQSEETTQKVVQYLSFHTYVENGSLCYVEQDLDRLERLFSNYDTILLKDFGFDTDFLITLYRFSDLVSAEKHSRAYAFTQRPEFAKFVMNTDNKSYEERLEKLPDDIINDLDKFLLCTHISFKFTEEEYASALPAEKINRFLSLFAFKPEPDDKFLFFSQPNPLEDKPILLLPSGEYLHIYQRQIPLAVGKFFYTHLLKDVNLSDKLRKHRDKALEEKTETIFRKFFGKEERTFFYRNYHVEKNTEQDILVLSKNLALIIEIKASKYREPFRDPVKGYDRLKSDFKDAIQYGYDQCLRIEDKFFDNDPFVIYDKNEKPLYKINPKKYAEVYSIVVTLERFGPIQSDLNFMLQKDEGSDFPWSVYIDDLETFLLALKKTYTNPIPSFKIFLKQRSTFHGRAYIVDEMDVCGTFLSNRKLFSQVALNKEASATFLPDNQGIFDDLYHTGLGFEDELSIEYKRIQKPRKTPKTKSWLFGK